ncbi:MAG: XRE family transcriptional regulator [Hymenobacter sp.]|nr:MAG: XRE family transcriptional regulator [Hymenobacter sp.]
MADLLAQIPPREEEKRFVDKSLQLAGLIAAAMQRQHLTQKALAERLGKQESEVSRWLTGLHNFTLKTLTRLEAVLGEELILTFRDQVARKAEADENNWAAPSAAWQSSPTQTVQPAPNVMVEDYNILQAA